MSESEADSDEVKVISWSLVSEAVDLCLNSTKILEDLKQEAHDISCAVQPIIEEEGKDETVSTLLAVSIFEQVTSEKMAEVQQKDPTLELVYWWVKIKNISYSQNEIKGCEKIFTPVQQTGYKKGVLHQHFTNNDVEYHQMVLPLKYQAQVLQLLHDGQGC